MKLKINTKWQFLAMDDCGTWFFYNKKPRMGVDMWMARDCEVRLVDHLFFELPDSETDWSKTLYQRNGDEWELVDG